MRNWTLKFQRTYLFKVICMDVAVVGNVFRSLPRRTILKLIMGTYDFEFQFADFFQSCFLDIYIYIYIYLAFWWKKRIFGGKNKNLVKKWA